MFSELLVYLEKRGVCEGRVYMCVNALENNLFKKCLSEGEKVPLEKKKSQCDSKF